ncbi:MAG TPA: diaminopimelate epimerase, partial [Bdellovibrionota bacterium]
TVLVEVWERGAGATLSCGSGAVAVAAVVRRRTKAERVHVKMTDFTLQVRFEDERAYLSGPCVLVAKGEICF